MHYDITCKRKIKSPKGEILIWMKRKILNRKIKII